MLPKCVTVVVFSCQRPMPQKYGTVVVFSPRGSQSGTLSSVSVFDAPKVCNCRQFQPGFQSNPVEPRSSQVQSSPIQSRSSPIQVQSKSSQVQSRSSPSPVKPRSNPIQVQSGSSPSPVQSRSSQVQPSPVQVQPGPGPVQVQVRPFKTRRPERQQNIRAATARFGKRVGTAKARAGPPWNGAGPGAPPRDQKTTLGTARPWWISLPETYPYAIE